MRWPAIDAMWMCSTCGFTVSSLETGASGCDRDVPPRVPQGIDSAVGGAAEDEQQVRQPVQITDHFRIGVFYPQRVTLGSPTDGPADV